MDRLRVGGEGDRRGKYLVTRGIVDVAAEAVTIEATGSSDKLTAFLRLLEPYGIKELVQSGIVAVGRGPRSISDRAVRAVERTA